MSAATPTDSYDTSPTAEAVKEWRARVRLTQKQAAHIARVSVRTWEKWEIGAQSMPPGLWELVHLKQPKRARAPVADRRPIVTARHVSSRARHAPSRDEHGASRDEPDSSPDRHVTPTPLTYAQHPHTSGDEYLIAVSEVFSESPSGRLRTHGPFSGEAFREDWLWPALQDYQRVVVNLEGTLGLGAAFLDEAFVGLLQVHGLTVADLRKRLVIQTRFQLYADYVWRRFREEEGVQTP